MPSLRTDKPLTDAEQERLQELLALNEEGMNLEEMDGFFSALIAGPEVVLPREALPQVFGGANDLGDVYETMKDVQELLSLIMRHWNGIAGTLARDEMYWPVILEDEHGEARGNDWADGFISGTKMRPEGWNTLMRDDDHAGCLVPALMLHHENDPDPALRSPAITAEKRCQVPLSS